MSVQIFSRYKRPLISGCSFKKPSLTSQEFKDDCNVNKILLRYVSQARLLGVPLSEVLPKLDSQAFRDVSNVEDFQRCMNRVCQMRDLFASCPSDVRRKYADDLENFVKGLHNPADYEFLAEHGVLDHAQVKEFMEYANKYSIHNNDNNACNSSTNLSQPSSDGKTAENSAN